MAASKPVRPSAQRAVAARLERDDNVRLVLELSPKTRRALKVRAAENSKTIKGYLLELMKRDGMDVDD
jgi:hypothetical protein